MKSHTDIFNKTIASVDSSLTVAAATPRGRSDEARSRPARRSACRFVLDFDAIIDATGRLTANQLAMSLRVPANRITAIIAEKRGITEYDRDSSIAASAQRC